METLGEIFDNSSRTQTHWTRLYNINVYERTVLQRLNSSYFFRRSVAERNIEHSNKLLERWCFSAFSDDHLSLLSGDT